MTFILSSAHPIVGKNFAGKGSRSKDTKQTIQIPVPKVFANNKYLLQAEKRHKKLFEAFQEIGDALKENGETQRKTMWGIADPLRKIAEEDTSKVVDEDDADMEF